MNYIKLFFLVILMSPVFISCKKDFLELADNSTLNRQTYIKDLSTLQEYLNGIYVMYSRDFEDGFAGAYSDLVADNIKPSSSTYSLLMPHYTWTQQADEINAVLLTATSRNMNPVWKTGYLIIRSCNFVLENIDTYRGDDPGKADDMKAQAYAIRALVHFKLVNIFAQPYNFTQGASHQGIPYITVSDITQSFIRQTVAEVYDNIIADFNSAIQSFSTSITDTRYINSAAAKALLARAYLYKENYSAAKTLAMEIGTQFPLMTVSGGYPNDLFKLKSPSKTECLFQLSPQSTGYVTNFVGRYFRGTQLRFVATDDVSKILKESSSDVRNAWVTSTSGVWNITKYPTAAAPEVSPAISPVESAYYPAIIRSSEMFLTTAECCAKLGDENNARIYLDAIRKRANPSVASLTATGAALLDSVYKERRKELAFEGFRLFDIQRTKQAIHRVDALFSTSKDLPYSQDQRISPVPQFDVKLAALPQNSGY